MRKSNAALFQGKKKIGQKRNRREPSGKGKNTQYK